MTIEELKKLAEAATPGPWIGESVWVMADKDDLLRCGSSRDAAFIAAANPAVVLKLLELVEISNWLDDNDAPSFRDYSEKRHAYRKARHELEELLK